MSRNRPFLTIVHIPKTAGTSLRRSLLFSRAGPRLIRAYWPLSAGNLAWVRLRRRLGADTLIGHVNVGVADILGVPPCYATVLRPPVERIVSMYDYMRSMRFDPAYHILRGGMTLGEFFRRADEFGQAGQFRNQMTFMLSGSYYRGHARAGPADLDRAIANLERGFRLVGIQKFAGDYIEAVHGLAGAAPRFRFRANRRRVPKTDPDPETRAMIEAANDLDQALYDYVASRAESAGGVWRP